MDGLSGQLEHSALVDFHFRCLQGMYFSEYLPRENHILLFSDLVEDTYYNYVAHISGDLHRTLRETRTLFTERDRVPALYITPLSDLYTRDRRVPDGLSEWAVDAWMVLRDSGYLDDYRCPNYVDIEAVSQDDRDAYVNVFEWAYSSEDPDDPYGALPDYYGRTLCRSFDTLPSGYQKQYVWAKIGGKPVGVGSMLWDEHIAGVYSVGTVGSYRNRGVGTSIMAHLVMKARAEGVPNVMLQTELGSPVERWYVEMGFTTVFTGTYYVEEV